MRKIYLNKFMKYLLLSISIFIISSNSDTAFANSMNITGTWDSNWGRMVFEQTGNNVTGTYATSNGKIFGTFHGNILEGYWTQSSAGKKCSTQKYDSFYWGRISFVFDHQNNHFSGSWGYCEDTPSSGGWSGTKQKILSLQKEIKMYILLSQEHGTAIGGKWYLNKPEIM